MSGLAANAMLFSPGAVGWSRDISKAYLTAPFGGCKGGFSSHPKRFKAPGHRRHWIGCTPETCTRTCSKSLIGVRWRDITMCYAAPTFGTRCGGDVFNTLLQPLLRMLKSLGVLMIQWVDDVLFILPNTTDPSHDPHTCRGRGTCPHCDATFARALELEAIIDAEIELLGFLTNDKKTHPAQDGDFLGLGWDTVKCTFVLTQEKALSLAALASEILATQSTTPRTLAQFRGRLHWYSPCL